MEENSEQAMIASGEDGMTADAIVKDGATDDLAAIRELVLTAHPDIVPELIGGESIGEVLASVGPAKEAFARLADRFQTVQSVAASNAEPDVRVPAGGGGALVIDPDQLPASEKIRRGVAAASRAGQGR